MFWLIKGTAPSCLVAAAPTVACTHRLSVSLTIFYLLANTVFTPGQHPQLIVHPARPIVSLNTRFEIPPSRPPLRLVLNPQSWKSSDISAIRRVSVGAAQGKAGDGGWRLALSLSWGPPVCLRWPV
eukprot:m.481462 g.481462  ORF g.481462 m.481462 type:complete len:126 (-) comp57071_c0_seq1:112-489(-)